MIKITLTHHAEADRLDRLATILQVLDLGKIIQERIDLEKETTMCLTSTGIMLVKSKRIGKLITGFMATVNQMAYVYGDAVIPSTIKQVVKYNNKKYAFLLKK